VVCLFSLSTGFVDFWFDTLFPYTYAKLTGKCPEYLDPSRDTHMIDILHLMGFSPVFLIGGVH